MNPRLRKLIGLFAILGFLLLYMGLAVRLAAFVPQHGIWQALYFIVSGVAWFVPMLPLITWMNHGRFWGR